MFGNIDGPFQGDPTARAILLAAEAGVRERRVVDVADLERLLAWADLHSVDPQSQPGATPVSKGGSKLVLIGGEGTPELEDLCVAEMAIARQVSDMATRNAMANALDLRHRLPEFWAEVRAHKVDVWVARKIARLTRRLTPEQCEIADRAVAEAAGQGAARLLEITEAKVMEADVEAQADRLAAQAKRQGGWLSKRRPGDQIDGDDPDASPGLRTIFARMSEGKAVDLDATVDEIADLLAEHGDYDPENPPTRDQLRADALALLADPAAVLSLMQGDGSTCRRRPATVFVHLSDAALGGADGVARVEAMGPMLLQQLADLIGRRDISLTPVIDLHDWRSVNGYEHPTDVRQRTELRTLGDVYPYSTSRPGARTEHDHPNPYNKAGPAGQTGDANDAPLNRRHHRVKTHKAFRLVQAGPGRYLWRTPHGLVHQVTPRGTVAMTPRTSGEERAVNVVLDYGGSPAA